MKVCVCLCVCVCVCVCVLYVCVCVCVCVRLLITRGIGTILPDAAAGNMGRVLVGGWLEVPALVPVPVLLAVWCMGGP